ncbi:MAG TPA: response regulator [Ktedonobacterales bacterium]|nr:response regulator [Ktedonobacterales bacterium]
MQPPFRPGSTPRHPTSGELLLTPPRPAPAEATILVVENEANNRCLMEQILGFAGYRYRSATNGLEALDVLDHEHIDLVLIDLSMPVLDGYRATEIIRQRPGGATLPIVAVTAHAMSEDRELALQSGCTDYLAKPYRATDLLRVVERLLRGMGDSEGL